MKPKLVVAFADINNSDLLPFLFPELFNHPYFYKMATKNTFA